MEYGKCRKLFILNYCRFISTESQNWRWKLSFDLLHNATMLRINDREQTATPDKEMSMEIFYHNPSTYLIQVK